MVSALCDLTVNELLKRCAARPADEAAWQEFVRRYQATIRAFVVRTFHQKVHADADRKQQFSDDTIEDLVQAVYLKLISDHTSALERFAGEFERSIFQYLGIIATNVVRDHFREMLAQKRPRITVSLDQLLEDGDFALANEGGSMMSPPPDVQTGLSFALEEIEEVLRKVVRGRNGARDTLIFKLRFFHEMSLAEIIRATGSELSPVGVSSIINRTAARVRPILARKYGIRQNEPERPSRGAGSAHG
jgi:RNA polymerase sigma factor (sigma-70 family)